MVKENGEYKAVPQREKINDIKLQAPKGFGIRHIQTLILFFSLSIGFAMRAHLSVTIVAMTETPATYINNSCQFINDINLSEHHKKNDLDNLKNGSDSLVLKDNNETICQLNSITTRRMWGIDMTYDWSKGTEEIIMFAFFVGYTSANLPMGQLAQKYGWKIPICVALFCNGVLSIVTPWVATVGNWWAICLLRFFQGLTQAAYYPSIHSMLGKWAPLCERGRLTTYIYTGSQFGTVFSFQIAGLLAGSPIFGWPSTFLVLGCLSLICFVLLVWLGADSPQDHPRIGHEELVFITGSGSTIVPKRRRTPWKQIVTCKAVWGAVVSMSGSTLCYNTLLTQIPLYMNEILHVDIKNNGLLSSLPYISMYCLSILFGTLADFITKRKYLSTVNTRRIFTTIGMSACGILLFMFGFVSKTYLAVALLVICMGMHSGVHLGHHINFIDLAPNFAGPMMALGNCIANLTGLFIPVLVSLVIKEDMANAHRWQILFGIIMGTTVVTNIIFVIFAKGEVLPWNFYNGNEQDTKHNEHNMENLQNEKENNDRTSTHRFRTIST